MSEVDFLKESMLFNMLFKRILLYGLFALYISVLAFCYMFLLFVIK